MRYVVEPSTHLLCPICAVRAAYAAAHAAHTLLRFLFAPSSMYATHRKSCTTALSPLACTRSADFASIKYCKRARNVRFAAPRYARRSVLLGRGQADRRAFPCLAQLAFDELHKNTLVQDLLDEMTIYCPNSAQGCSETFPLVHLSTHVASCAHTLKPCPYRRYGCPFEAAQHTLADHIDRVCPYAQVREYLRESDRKIEVLEHALRVSQDELVALRAEVTALRTAVQAADGHMQGRAAGAADGVVAPAVAAVAAAAASAAALAPAPAFDALTLRAHHVLVGHTSGVTALCLGARHLYSGSQDTTIRVWSLDSFECVHVMQGKHAYTVWALVEVPADAASSVASSASQAQPPVLFSASSDHSISKWIHYEHAQSVVGHTGKIYAMTHVPPPSGAESGARGWLASGGADAVVRLWDLHSCAARGVLAGHTAAVCSLALVPGSEAQLASGSDDATVRLWDVAAGECLRVIAAPTRVLAVAVAPGAARVYAACLANIVVFEAASDYAAVATLRGHKWEVWQVQLLGSGDLVSAAFDHRIKLWSGQPEASCTRTIDDGHVGYIHALAQRLHPRHGQLLASGGGDKKIILWRCP